ncbi:MAG: fibrobacter succinogenes major paralogous domain-containing protein [Bacteroidota bacterium]
MKRKLLPVLIILLIPVLNSCEEDNDNHSDLTVTDYDGNTYKTIQIGDQIWMAENLKTTHYSDGTIIQLVEDESDWKNLKYSDKAMCTYDNSEVNREIYGALYTWEAAMRGSYSSETNPSGVQGVCPDGWHLPSDDEWKEVEMYLGMSQTEADRYNFRGTNEGSQLAGDSSLWNEGILVNDVEFGSSGFMALPAGYRNANSGRFYQLQELGTFWCATESGDTLSITRLLNPHWIQVHRFTYSKKSGNSVRCIKD